MRHLISRFSFVWSHGKHQAVDVSQCLQGLWEVTVCGSLLASPFLNRRAGSSPSPSRAVVWSPPPNLELRF